jgi:hypothetical protein
MKYNGSTWEYVGNPGFSSNVTDWSATIYGTSLFVYNGIPYIAYTDGGNGNKVTVMKFSAD